MPQQNNGVCVKCVHLTKLKQTHSQYDCGVFVCAAALCVAHDLDLKYTQVLISFISLKLNTFY